MKLAEARAYVGTTPVSGAAQFSLLVREGLRPEHKLLEYGCGTLHLGKLLMAYLLPSRYCAVEPNVELVDAACNGDHHLAYIDTPQQRPRLLVRDDFDASGFGESFDYVFAHSVLSHASRTQLPAFFAAAAAVLAPGGRIVASLRIGPDSDDAEWVYPGVSWFSHETVTAAALDAGLWLVPAPRTRAAYVALCPDEIHDWILAWHR